MTTTPLNRITKNIHAATRILLLTHQNPDPDAIGATMAMKLVLEAQRKQVNVIYVSTAPKVDPPTGKGILIYDAASQAEDRTVDLADYDYALVLDTGLSTQQITGLLIQGVPRLGVGIIDHHTRTDQSSFPEQDYTLPDKSSVCEILYNYINDSLSPFAEQPPTLRRAVARYLLHGMLDDMVGLLIPEKLSADNLTILESLKKRVGQQVFTDVLEQTRTLSLPNPLEQYAPLLSHTSYQDQTKRKYHLYALHVPASKSPPFKKDYTNLLFLFEHYARTSCAKQGWQYGGFLLTIEAFSPGTTKVSARGSYMKQLFTPLLREKGLFLSAGISGDSAVGGKVASNGDQDIGSLLKKKLKAIASKLTLKSKYDAEAYLRLESRAQLLINGEQKPSRATE